MKTVVIKRNESSDLGTFGVLFIDNKPFCFTGELPVDHDNDGILNERNLEAILQGEYIVSPRSASESKAFKYPHYIINNVVGRDHVLIHKGNYVGDITDGYESDIKGCIVLGTKIGILNNQKSILSSAVAFNKFCKVIGRNSFKLIIKNEY